MIYLFALVLTIAIGFLTVRLILGARSPLYLSVCLGSALGLGMVSQIVFYIQILGNNFHHLSVPVVTILLIGILFFFNKRKDLFPRKLPLNWSLIVLLFLFLPLWLEAHYYPLGGWDAWSCWNLKAKFIYLGSEHWKDMLAPHLWRSNTHYPLALPSIHVWFWQFTGFSQTVPMINAIILTLLNAGILMLAMQELKVTKAVSSIVTLAMFTLGFGNTLCISQYSDILFSLYLLSAIVCYLISEHKKEPQWLFLSALFAGLLCFTKNEGLVAGVLFILLCLLQKSSRTKTFVGFFFLAALPTVIFSLTIAPPNEAFINGLLSPTQPSTLERLGYIFIYPFKEILAGPWNGLWIIAAIGIMASFRRSFQKPLCFIGLLLGLYLGVVLAYYQVNTFFKIDWWMDTTFNRIIFSLMPCVFLWMGVSVFGIETKKAS